MLKDIALKYFKNGYSCSESIIQACADEGLCSLVRQLFPAECHQVVFVEQLVQRKWF